MMLFFATTLPQRRVDAVKLKSSLEIHQVQEIFKADIMNCRLQTYKILNPETPK